MKTLTKILTVGILVLGMNLSQAAEKVTAGAKGGRLLENDSPRAEFFVEKDRTVTLTFYGADMKPVPVQDQSATAIAENPEGKTKIQFEKKGDVLVSKSPLPAGEKYTVVLQLKQTTDSKPKNFRIPLNTAICEKCHRPEYACTCGDD
ncbi:MAG: hypothetical protein JWR19_3935 [Pedosphaera sp.]|nr:hypothetical protein [Pedosphaera sp.]